MDLSNYVYGLSKSNFINLPSEAEPSAKIYLNDNLKKANRISKWQDLQSSPSVTQTNSTRPTTSIRRASTRIVALALLRDAHRARTEVYTDH